MEVRFALIALAGNQSSGWNRQGSEISSGGDGDANRIRRMEKRLFERTRRAVQRKGNHPVGILPIVRKGIGCDRERLAHIDQITSAPPTASRQGQVRWVRSER